MAAAAWAAAVAGGLFAALHAQAQQAGNGGVAVDLTFSQLLEHDDDETLARTELGLTYVSRTHAQTLTFGVSGALESGLDSDAAGDLADPRFRFGYMRDSRNAALNLDLNYRRAETSTLAFEQDLDEGALVAEDVERENLSAQFGLELGREAPFGATISLRYAESNFIDTNRADLVDSETTSGTIELRFDLTPTATAFTSVSSQQTLRDGASDVQQDSVRARLEAEITPALMASASLGHTRVERTDDVTTRVNRGLSYALSLTAERPNGTISGSLESDVSENGRRTTLLVNRQILMPRGTLSFGGGVSHDDDTGGLEPLYNVDYLHELPLGQIRLNLSQAFTSNSTGAETLDSRAQISVQHQLSDLSNFSATLGLRDSNRLNRAGGDSSQISLSFDYTRTLTDDWSFVSGVSHIRRMRDARADTTENRIFVGLRSSFGWRP